MADTGWVDPGSAVNVDTGGAAWGTPTNALTENSVYTTVGAVSSAATDRLITSNYDFSIIPPNSTIDGIEMRFRRYENGSRSTSDSTIYLMQNTTIKSSNYSRDQWPTGPAYSANYGSPTDLWGWTDITSSDVKSSTFGIGIQAIGSYTTANNSLVDVVQVKVYYTPPASMSTLMMVPF